jgi:DNA polymerase-3 subunit gamma/tau
MHVWGCRQLPTKSSASATAAQKPEVTTPLGNVVIRNQFYRDGYRTLIKIALFEGIDDIREILEGVRYAPTSARYKVYIIDEVHMLSKQAFNALLKTLEEPPSHVKFIFATTEIRKVPITILSRCQRFDLKRVDVPTLSAHFMAICEKEGKKADEGGMELIARAADGSVRDGLSLLDQAMALSGDDVITDDLVARMMGTGDRNMIFTLLGHAIAGDPDKALHVMRDLYAMGTAPRLVIEDMMDMIHGLSIMAMGVDLPLESIPHSMMDQAKNMSQKLNVPQLQKAWQILLKGMEELHHALDPQKAAEMIILRLIYAADLPDPADLLKKIKEGQAGSNAQAQGRATAGAPQGGGATQSHLRAVPTGGGQAAAAAIQEPLNHADAQDEARHAPIIPTSLQEMIALFETNGEMMLASHLYQDVACVKFQKGHIELYAYDNAPSDLASRVSTCLKQWTGDPWMVALAQDVGDALTLAEAKRRKDDEGRQRVLQSPMVSAVLEYFPDARIVKTMNKDESEGL